MQANLINIFAVIVINLRLKIDNFNIAEAVAVALKKLKKAHS